MNTSHYTAGSNSTEETVDKMTRHYITLVAVYKSSIDGTPVVL